MLLLDISCYHYKHYGTNGIDNCPPVYIIEYNYKYHIYSRTHVILIFENWTDWAYVWHIRYRPLHNDMHNDMHNNMHTICEVYLKYIHYWTSLDLSIRTNHIIYRLAEPIFYNIIL